jgi:hypothetical protein
MFVLLDLDLLFLSSGVSSHAGLFLLLLSSAVRISTST